MTLAFSNNYFQGIVVSIAFFPIFRNASCPFSYTIIYIRRFLRWNKYEHVRFTLDMLRHRAKWSRVYSFYHACGPHDYVFAFPNLLLECSQVGYSDLRRQTYYHLSLSSKHIDVFTRSVNHAKISGATPYLLREGDGELEGVGSLYHDGT